MTDKKNLNVLYITYLGILEPIPKSQVLPYLFKLSDRAQIYLLSFEKSHIIRKDPMELKRMESLLSKKGIKWSRLPYHKDPRFVSSFFDIFAGIIFSFLIVLKYRVNIIHARSNIPIAIGYILKMLFPVKLIYDRRGIMGDDHTEHSGWKKGGILHKAALKFEAMAFKKSDTIIVLADRMNKYLKDNLKLRQAIDIVTIPCCVDLNKFNYDRSAKPSGIKNQLGLSDRFIFVYSGSLGTYNMLNEMLDFFKNAQTMIPNAHFLILTQNKEDALEFIRTRNDLNPGKFTVLFVKNDEIPDYLSLADAALVFRRPSSTAIAASPTKFAEYLACGLPVISTPGTGDLDEIIRSNKIGVILKSQKVEDYIEAVNSLLELLKDRDTLRSECRKTAEDLFSLDKGVSAYLDIYIRSIKSSL